MNTPIPSAVARAQHAAERATILHTQNGTAVDLSKNLRRLADPSAIRAAAADCENGVPVVGSLAYQKIKQALAAGDAAEVAHLRAQIIAFAPKLYAEADRLEVQAEVDERARVARELATLERLKAADAKRERKAARNIAERSRQMTRACIRRMVGLAPRARAQEANMRNGARQQ